MTRQEFVTTSVIFVDFSEKRVGMNKSVAKKNTAHAVVVDAPNLSPFGGATAMRTAHCGNDVRTVRQNIS